MNGSAQQGTMNMNQGGGGHRFTQAAEALVAAIEAESEALARLDVSQAACLSRGKTEAANRFLEARGSLDAGIPVDAAESLHRLTEAVGRNRALLARAIAAQKSLIEVVVQPMRAAPQGYSAGVRQAGLRQAGPPQPAVAFARSA